MGPGGTGQDRNFCLQVENVLEKDWYPRQNPGARKTKTHLRNHRKFIVAGTQEGSDKNKGQEGAWDQI